MKRLIIAATFVLPLLAQQQAVERTTKLVHLKYADPQALRNVLSQFGVNIMPESGMKVMTIEGPPQRIAAVEAALQQLDVAPKNVELTVHFLIGSDQVMPGNSQVPADIRDVIAQLKGTFTFKDYRMLDVLTIRTRAGSPAETSGILDTRTSPPRLSMFSVRNVTVSDDGATVRIDRMHAGLRIPITHRNETLSTKTGGGVEVQSKTEYTNTGIDQDIDVKEGQKVVVGRSSLEGPAQALFVILTAKVL